MRIEMKKQNKRLKKKKWEKINSYRKGEGGGKRIELFALWSTAKWK